jgi:hypothetical protein
MHQTHSLGISHSQLYELFSTQPRLIGQSDTGEILHHLVTRLRIFTDPLNEKKSILLGNEPIQLSKAEHRGSYVAMVDTSTSEASRLALLDGMVNSSHFQELKSRQRLLQISSRPEAWTKRHFVDTSNYPSFPICYASKHNLKSANHSTAKVNSKIDHIQPSRNLHRLETASSEFTFDLKESHSTALSVFKAAVLQLSAQTVCRIKDRTDDMRAIQAAISESKSIQRQRTQTFREQRCLEKKRRKSVWESLEITRVARVLEKMRLRDLLFAESFHEQRRNEALTNKQTNSRIAKCRSSADDAKKQLLKEKCLRLRNLTKLSSKRGLNCDFHLQKRERRARELEWMRERRDTASLPYILTQNECRLGLTGSVIESIKTSKTGSSSSQMKKLREEMLKEKADFFSRIDRTERINQRMQQIKRQDVPKTKRTFEIDRLAAWREHVQAKEQQLAVMRVERMRLKMANQRLGEAAEIQGWSRNAQLDDQRRQVWEAHEKQQTAIIVENAFAVLAAPDKLIPCLAI